MDTNALLVVESASFCNHEYVSIQLLLFLLEIQPLEARAGDTHGACSLRHRDQPNQLMA
jgi:hypothetical protein